MDFNSTFERRKAVARILKNKPYVTTNELSEILGVKSYIISKDRKYISQHIELFNNIICKQDNDNNLFHNSEKEQRSNDANSVVFPNNVIFENRRVKVAYLMMEYYYAASCIIKILNEPSYTIYRDMKYVREHYEYFRKLKNNNWNDMDTSKHEIQWKDSKLTRLRFKVYKILCDNGDMSSSKIAEILNVSWKKVNTAKKFINSHIELFQDIPYEQVKRLAKGISITVRNKKCDGMSKDELEPKSSIFNMGKSNDILFNKNRKSTNADKPVNNNHPNPFLM